VTQDVTGKKAEPVISRLARLSRADMPPDEFMKEFFALVRDAFAAEGGSLWLYNAENRQLVSKAAMQPHTGPAGAVTEETLSRIVYGAIEKKSPALYLPQQDATEEGTIKDVSLMTVPVELDEKNWAALVLARRTDGGLRYSPEDVYTVQSLCTYLALYFTYLQVKRSVAVTSRLVKLAEIESDLAATSERDKMAFILANRTRELAFFDRVFVAFPRGSSWRIAAVSGIDDVQQKSATAHVLAELVKEFARIGGDWHFTPEYLKKVEDEGLREKLPLYFESSDYKSILLVRLESGKDLLGVIAFERRDEGTYLPAELQFLQAYVRASARALKRAEEFRSLPGIALAKRAASLREKALGPQRNRFFIKVGAVAAALAILAFGRMELTVKGDCKIVSQVSGFAAPQITGTVRQMLKKEGDSVKKGESIALLDDRDIQNAMQETALKIEQSKARVAEFASKDVPRWNEETLNLKIYENQLRQLELRLEAAAVASPQDGVIVTRQDRLNAVRDAVVQSGTPICEIADVSSLSVEVEVEERDIGLVKVGQPITFTLAGAPGKVFRSRVEAISPVTSQTMGKNYFIARGAVDNSQGRFRPGLTGAAGVPAGKAPLVYVMFRRTIEWVRLKFL